MRPRLSGIIVSAMFLVASAVQASDQSASLVVYNHITEEGRPYDEMFKAAYSSTYQFVDVVAGPSFKRAEIIAGGRPSTPINELGEPVHGYILVSYVISVDGLATEPKVLKITDSSFADATLQAMRAWRFTPAVFNGTPVATLAGQEFYFGPTR